jgi:hypothetical protein
MKRRIKATHQNTDAQSQQRRTALDSRPEDTKESGRPTNTTPRTSPTKSLHGLMLGNEAK